MVSDHREWSHSPFARGTAFAAVIYTDLCDGDISSGCKRSSFRTCTASGRYSGRTRAELPLQSLVGCSRLLCLRDALDFVDGQ